MPQAVSLLTFLLAFIGYGECHQTYQHHTITGFEKAGRFFDFNAADEANTCSLVMQHSALRGKLS